MSATINLAAYVVSVVAMLYALFTGRDDVVAWTGIAVACLANWRISALVEAMGKPDPLDASTPSSPRKERE